MVMTGEGRGSACRSTAQLRCYVSAVLAVGLCVGVCLSVCLSVISRFVSKRLHGSSWLLAYRSQPTYVTLRLNEIR